MCLLCLRKIKKISLMGAIFFYVLLYAMKKLCLEDFFKWNFYVLYYVMYIQIYECIKYKMLVLYRHTSHSGWPECYRFSVVFFLLFYVYSFSFSFFNLPRCVFLGFSYVDLGPCDCLMS